MLTISISAWREYIIEKVLNFSKKEKKKKIKKTKKTKEKPKHATAPAHVGK
jgi:hypothetical protein